MPSAPLLELDKISTHYVSAQGTRVVRAVQNVSLTVQAGETLGIVGESGCGKSVTALSIMRLLPPRLGRTVRGSVAFEGRDLLGLDESEMRMIRGNRIAMIFQEPMTSLNPVLTIGHQIAESVRIHEGASPAEARARAVSMLNLVRIPDGERRLDDYPHQFSGGMRQRVMIAMALACNPRLLIADEAERLAGADRKAHPVHRLHLRDGAAQEPTLHREVLLEVCDLEDGGGHAASTPSAITSSAKWQAATCPPATCRSGGASTRQRSAA